MRSKERRLEVRDWCSGVSLAFIIIRSSRHYTNRDTLVFLHSETSDVATRFSERKRVQGTELDIVNGSLCNLYALVLGWRYIFSLHCADELQQERNSCPQVGSCFIGSGHVGVSKCFSRSINLAVYCLYTHIFG